MVGKVQNDVATVKAGQDFLMAFVKDLEFKAKQYAKATTGKFVCCLISSKG